MRLLDAVRYGDARSCSDSRVVALGLVGVSAYLGSDSTVLVSVR
jgi:hypothetical protein